MAAFHRFAAPGSVRCKSVPSRSSHASTAAHAASHLSPAPAKELKHDLAIRPIFHQREERIEAHIFVSFLAYSLLVTLKNLARPRAPGLTPRAILEKFSTIQMVDVHLPTTDGRRLVLPRHTRPNQDHELLLHQLGLKLPEQPAPRLSV